MQRYDKIAGDWVDLDTWYARRAGTLPTNTGPAIQGDLKPFRSPLGQGVVNGRRDLREHLARNECRVVEPSEWRPRYYSGRHAAGGEIVTRPAPKQRMAI